MHRPSLSLSKRNFETDSAGFSCFRCTQGGVTVNRHLVPPSNKWVAINGNEFWSRKQKGHHSVRHHSSHLYDKCISFGLYARSLSRSHQSPNKYMAQGCNEQESTHRINPSADRWRQATVQLSIHPVWVPTKMPAVIWSLFNEYFQISPVSSYLGPFVPKDNFRQYDWQFFWNSQFSHSLYETKECYAHYLRYVKTGQWVY